jgi:hypothetical protein
MIFPDQADGEKRFYHDTEKCTQAPRKGTTGGGRTSNSGGGRGRGRGDGRTGGAGSAAGVIPPP